MMICLCLVTCHQGWFQNDYNWSSWDGWPESMGYFWYQLVHDIDNTILVADVAATWCGILTLSLHVSRVTTATIFCGQLEFKCYDEKWWVWQPGMGWRQIFSCINVLSTKSCTMWDVRNPNKNYQLNCCRLFTSVFILRLSFRTQEQIKLGTLHSTILGSVPA